jgi:mannose-6-phosphate isomerase-like protein (cupin superfamily)
VDSHAVHEIWIVTAGEGQLTYDDRQLRVRCSDVLYFEPPKPHLVSNDGVETMVIFSIWWKI